MSCISLPAVTPPTLPSPLSLTPPSVDPPEFELELCCKLPPIEIPLPPIPLPPLVLNPAVIASLNAYIEQACTYVNSLSLSCPLE